MREWKEGDKSTLFCGFVDSAGERGWLVYIGGKLKAVSFVTGDTVPNKSYGELKINLYNTVMDFCDRGTDPSTPKVEKIFMFESLEELFHWGLYGTEKSIVDLEIERGCDTEAKFSDKAPIELRVHDKDNGSMTMYDRSDPWGTVVPRLPSELPEAIELVERLIQSPDVSSEERMEILGVKRTLSQIKDLWRERR